MPIHFWKLAITTLLLFVAMILNAQSTNESSKNWDNQIYMGNKITAGKNNWRFSGELQIRLDENMQSLDNWFMEGVATYMISEKFELVPDFRISIKPDEIEYRPGFGVVYKFIKGNFQFVNQLKWQFDADNQRNRDHGMRYAVFVNHKLSEKLMSNFAAGFFYRWQEGFQGFQYVRFGPGLVYILDKKHTLNFSYLLSTENNGQNWAWAGIPVIQLIININKEYKYMPAKYFNF